MATGFVRAEGPSGAGQGPVGHGSLAQPCAELSANQDLQNEIPIVLRKNQNYVNPPAGGQDANSAAPVDLSLSLAAIPTSNAAAQVRKNWADITEEVNPGAEEGFTLVQGRKRRRGSANSPTAAAPSSNPGGSRTIRRPQPSAGSVPRAQEIRVTRAHIAEARARQASSSEEHCVYIEHSPELEPFHYLRALDRMLGGTAGVIQITKVNGHQLLGLTNRGLAERLISEGLEVEGTLLRAFPFRKRAERITVGNLPFFVADSAVITALSPYGRVTSIAPKQMKAGPYVYVDGRRDVFITLHEGITIERLPTRLDINIKGQAWPAYLSSGIRCSRCHGQGHRRAICPLLAGLANNTRTAPPTTPAGVPPPTTPAPPQRSAAQPPAPTPSNPAMEVCSAPPVARAALHSSAPRPSPPVAPAFPMEETPPAPPPVTPAPSLQTPGSREPAAPTPDVEMSIVEETFASSTSSAKNATRVDLDAFIEGLPSVSFAMTDALGLGREEVLDLLSSRTKAQRKGPLLSPPQCDALVGLIGQILDLKPGHTSNLYKVLGQVKAELRTTPAVPPTPTLPAPWPAKPTPPALHGEKTSPDIATPPPPLSTEFIDACYDQANDIIYELSDERYLETLSDIGVTEGDIVEAIIFPDDREPLLRRLSTQKRTTLAGIVSAASERARSSDPFVREGLRILSEMLPPLIYSALEWYADEIISNPAIKRWEVVKEKLIQRFGSYNANPIVSASHRRLKREESIENYFQDKIRLLNQTHLTKEEKIHLLTDGLPNDWKDLIVAAQPTDTTKWFHIAASIEQNRASIQFKPKNKIHLATKNNDNRKNVCPFWCPICSKKGIKIKHWVADCEDYDPNYKKDRPNQNTSVKQVCGAPELLNVSTLTNTPTQGAFKLINISVEVNGIPAQAFVDTGATVSIINWRLFKRTRLQLQPNSDIHISQADGVTRTCGSLQTKVRIDKLIKPVTLHVMKNFQYPLLIGLDVASLFNLLIDVKDKTIYTKFDGLQNPILVNHLEEIREHELKELLEHNRNVFSQHAIDMGKVAIQHKIITKSEQPISLRPYRRPLKEYEEIAEQVKELLEHKLIRISDSPWAFPVVMVPKKDGNKRMCIDYRRLNEITLDDRQPLPHIQDMFDRLHGSRFFSTLDVAWGYWQIEMDPQSIQKTAFVTNDGHYEFLVMPFGLKNAASTFQRIIQHILGELLWKGTCSFQDDILVYTKTWQEHIELLSKVFDKLRQYNMKLKLSKCIFGRTEVKYLGHIISHNQLKPDPGKVKSIQDFPRPDTVKKVRQFMGLANYYRKFVKDFSKISFPLVRLTRKNQPFIWNEEVEESFAKLKMALSTKPVLAIYNPDYPSKVYTDASKYGIGAILTQIGSDNEEHVIAYYSKTLQPHQENYSAYEMECLAVIQATDHFHVYIENQPFEIITDHAALQWLFTMKKPKPKYFRWILSLSSKSCNIVHRSGKQQTHVDALSRLPVVNIATQELQEHQQNSDLFLEKFPHSRRCGITTDIKNYVRSCKSCQLVKVRHEPTLGEMITPTSNIQPLQMIGCDTIVLGTAAANTKHKFIQVFVDHATRYLWAYPTITNTAQAVTQCLDKIIKSVNSINTILTDNGKNFISKEFNKFLSLQGIKHTYTSPYHPQCNGICEKLNDTIMTKLRIAVLEKPRCKWSSLLPQVVKNYNSTPHDVTGFSPLFLMYGIGNVPEFADQTPITIEEARKKASLRTEQSRSKWKIKHDSHHPKYVFKEGDFVIRKIAFNDPRLIKTSPKYEGPFVIQKKISDVTYDISLKDQKQARRRMPGHRKRRQFKQTDAFTRGMVIGLKRAGWSIRQIAADTHLGASTVHRLWRRCLEQGNVAIYRNAGATRVTSARVDRRILRQAVAAPQATCTAILQHVQDTLDHSISTRTISRRLVHRALNPESTTPEPSSLKEIIREEIEKNVAAISKPIQRPPPRQSYPNQTRTFYQVPRRQYPTQTPIYNQRHHNEEQMNGGRMTTSQYVLIAAAQAMLSDIVKNDDNGCRDPKDMHQTPKNLKW
ncbi:K02A2.6-like, partial [Cordylochernes scorpioides]